MWQVLYAMDFLLTKLESVKDDIDEMDEDDESALPPYYTAGVLAAWLKINKYYKLTDESPIYRMAIALHPAYKFDYFRQKWWKRDDWIKAAEKDLSAYYSKIVRAVDDEEASNPSPASSPIEDEFDAWGHTTDRPRRGKKRKVETEWEAWIKHPPTAEERKVKNPLVWWIERRHIYPTLAKIAINILSMPAMSAEPERVFSDGSELITDKRNSLGDDTVEAEMLQKNWITRKVLMLALSLKLN